MCNIEKLTNEELVTLLKWSNACRDKGCASLGVCKDCLESTEEACNELMVSLFELATKRGLDVSEGLEGGTEGDEE